MAARQAATSTSGGLRKSPAENRHGSAPACAECACAESDGFNAASIDVAFVDVVAFRWRAISIARVAIRSKLTAQRREPAAGWILAASPDQHVYFSFGRVVENLGQIRASTTCSSTGAFSLLTITPVMLVFWHRRSCCGSVRYALSAVPGCSALRHNEDDFRIQRFSDFVVRDWANWCLRVGTRPSTRTTQRLWC